MQKDYQSVYSEFLKDYIQGGQSGREIGEAATRLAQCYTELNQDMLDAKILETETLVKFNAKKGQIAESFDPVSAKPIAMNKVDIMANATDEYAAWQKAHIEHMKAKSHVDTLDRYLAALRVLQYGVGAEQKFNSAM